MYPEFAPRRHRGKSALPITALPITAGITPSPPPAMQVKAVLSNGGRSRGVGGGGQMRGEGTHFGQAPTALDLPPPVAVPVLAVAQRIEGIGGVGRTEGVRGGTATVIHEGWICRQTQYESSTCACDIPPWQRLNAPSPRGLSATAQSTAESRHLPVSPGRGMCHDTYRGGGWHWTGGGGCLPPLGRPAYGRPLSP